MSVHEAWESLKGYGLLVTWLNETRTSYDTIATSYADEARDLLDRLLYVRAGSCCSPS